MMEPTTSATPTQGQLTEPFVRQQFEAHLSLLENIIPLGDNDNIREQLQNICIDNQKGVVNNLLLTKFPELHQTAARQVIKNYVVKKQVTMILAYHEQNTGKQIGALAVIPFGLIGLGSGMILGALFDYFNHALPEDYQNYLDRFQQVCTQLSCEASELGWVLEYMAKCAALMEADHIISDFYRSCFVTEAETAPSFTDMSDKVLAALKEKTAYTHSEYTVDIDRHIAEGEQDVATRVGCYLRAGFSRVFWGETPEQVRAQEIAARELQRRELESEQLESEQLAITQHSRTRTRSR